MAKTNFQSVDEYLATLPKATQEILERVREAIKKALPDAEEVISYQIPAYKLPGGVVVYFAGWKEHYSVYPTVGKVVTVLKDDLAKYEQSKGTVRFPLTQPVPVRLIRRIAKLRAEDVNERAAAKMAAKKKPLKKKAAKKKPQPRR